MHWDLGRTRDAGSDWDDIERLWQEIQSALPTPAPASWVSGDLLCSHLVSPEDAAPAAGPPPIRFAAGDDGCVRVAVAQPRRRPRRR